MNFERKLAAVGTLVLDGGLATELERRGCNLEHALWSALVLDEHPDAIVDVHRAYLDAGAHCITSSGYQASVRGFRAAGFDAARSEQLFRDSLRLAYRARDAHCRDRAIDVASEEAPLVAASIGPYGAYLADGSEFRGNYAATSEELREFHAERIALTIDEASRWTDEPLLAFETVPSLAEAILLLDILREYSDARAWLSFCCRDGGTTAEGQPIEQCAESVVEAPQLVSMGVNCTAPQHVAELLARIARTRLPAMAYPNAGGTYDAVAKAWRDGEAPRDTSNDVAEWQRAGLRVIGGCCRTTPAYIADVAGALAQGG